VGPTFNTTRFNFPKEGFVYFIGINESMFCYMCLVLKKCKENLGLSMPIPFKCGKDETKCIEIATWNRRLDMIDGFCGFLISPQHPTHQCKFDISPSLTTWTSINFFFETLQIGTMCCVLVANPLMVGLPRLVYCLMSICNQFGHLQFES
jgi:hypothetical protein